MPNIADDEHSGPTNDEMDPIVSNTIPPTSYSKTRKILMIIVTIIINFTTVGIIFGDAALRPVLLKEGVYEWLCDDNDDNLDPSWKEDGTSISVLLEQLDDDVPKPLCKAQELRLVLMFSIATSLTNISALLFGVLLDRLGPRFTGSLGGILFSVACVIFGLSSRSFDGYILAYVLFALAGPSLFLSSLHLSAAFPKHSGMIMSLITGAFDASSLIFYIFQKLYFSSDKMTLRLIFLVFASVGLFCLLCHVFILPKKSFENTEYFDENQTDDEIESLLNDNERDENRTLNGWRDQDQGQDRECGEVEDQGSYDYPEKLKHMSVKRQWLSWEFLLVTFTTCVMMLRLNFFIATVDKQVRYLFSDPSDYHDIENLVSSFNILLPLGGALAVPVGSFLLDKTRSSTAFFSIICMILAFGILTMFSNSIAQYIGIIFFVVVRPLFYTASNDFCARIFGLSNFGKVSGLMTLTSGVFNFLQYPLSDFSVRVNDGNFFAANLILLSTTFVALAFPLYLRFRKL